jgi:hypothetical protein
MRLYRVVAVIMGSKEERMGWFVLWSKNIFTVIEPLFVVGPYGSSSDFALPGKEFSVEYINWCIRWCFHGWIPGTRNGWCQACEFIAFKHRSWQTPIHFAQISVAVKIFRSTGDEREREAVSRVCEILTSLCSAPLILWILSDSASYESLASGSVWATQIYNLISAIVQILPYPWHLFRHCARTAL